MFVQQAEDSLVSVVANIVQAVPGNKAEKNIGQMRIRMRIGIDIGQNHQRKELG